MTRFIGTFSLKKGLSPRQMAGTMRKADPWVIPTKQCRHKNQLFWRNRSCNEISPSLQCTRWAWGGHTNKRLTASLRTSCIRSVNLVCALFPENLPQKTRNSLMKKTSLIAVMMLGNVNKKSRNQEIKKIKVQTNEKLSRLTSVASFSGRQNLLLMVHLHSCLRISRS